MALSQDLITQFAKLTVEPKDTNKAEIVKGTYKKVGDTEYVQIDGSEIWTPVKSTVNATAGDKVKVEIKNHIATITGNISNPSASSKEVDTLADTVDEHGNTIKQMNNTITQQGSSIRTIESTVNQVESTVNEYKAIVDIQETAIQAHDSAIRANTANIAINSSDIRSQGDDISSLNTTVRSQNTTINTMNDNIRSQGNQITAINNTVEAHGSRISTAEDNIVSQGNDIEVIDNKVIAQGNTINALDTQVSLHDSEIKANASQILTNKTNIEIADSDIQILNTGFKIEDGVLTGLSTAVINDLETNTLDAKYATIAGLDAGYAKIDFANIGIAAVTKVFTDSGIIKDLVVQDEHITGELVGVTLKGDLIDGNTIKADKLVVRGEDGLYYKLNIDGLDNITTERAYRFELLLEEPSNWPTNYNDYYQIINDVHVKLNEQSAPTWEAYKYYELTYSKFSLTNSQPENWSSDYKDYYVLNNGIYDHITGDTAPTWEANKYYKLNSDFENALDGTCIVAKSVTADKVSVNDLVAFDATIGKFAISGGSIHTVTKDSVSNDNMGIYMDNDGQFYFGDANNHVKFIKNPYFILTESEPTNWSTTYLNYYTKNNNGGYDPITSDTAPTWEANKYYEKRYNYLFDIKSSELTEYMNNTNTSLDILNTNTSDLQRDTGDISTSVNQLQIDSRGLTNHLEVVEDKADENTRNIEELTLDAQGLRLHLSEKGGNNLFKYLLDYWDDGAGGLPNLSTNIPSNQLSDMLTHSMSQRGYSVKSGNSRQIIQTDDNNYTISFLYKKINSTAVSKVIINGEETLLQDNDVWTRVTKTIDSSGSIAFILNTNIDDSLLITDLMCNYGTEPQVWSQNPREIVDTDVSIGKSVHVENNNINAYTDINTDGILIKNKSDNSVISRLDQTGTQTKYLNVDNGAEIAGLSIQQINNQIWFSSLL